jgi:transcriptional regulator with XRE-family HTH domain
MPTDEEWRTRIGRRLSELRALKGWSQAELCRRARDRVGKTQLSNYEQGIRMPGPEEASILGAALGESPAHILCLDDDMPALSKNEAKLINDLRALPERDRAAYADKIAALALAHKMPVPDARLLDTGFNPDRRPTASKSANKPTRKPE